MAASRGWGPTLTGVGQAERLSGAAISHDLFALLGVAPALGRFFLPEEDRPAAGRVVVFGYDLWQGRFGGDPDDVANAEQYGANAARLVPVDKDFDPLMGMPKMTGFAVKFVNRN